MKYFNYKQLLDYIKNNETTRVVQVPRLKTYYVRYIIEEINIVNDEFEKRVLKGTIVARNEKEAIYIMDKISKKSGILAYKFIDRPSEFRPLTYESKKRLYIKEMQICEEEE